MSFTKTLSSLAAAALIATLATGANAKGSSEAADELMAALKSCKAGKAEMSSAQNMIKKKKGSPSEDDVDNWVDDVEDEKLFKCLDKAL